MTVGVLVAQLGTPDEPTPGAVRSYLRQFLSDRRVIDYAPILWQPILRGIILRTRPRKSARLYARIWLAEGSPLLVYSNAQVAGLQQRLGSGYRVMLGMTYGNPSIAQAIAALEAVGIHRIIVLPMFPQFSSTTSASIYDSVYRAAAGHVRERKRSVPTLRFIAPYYDQAGYIQALKAQLDAEIASRPHTPDQFIISFHSIPRRYAQTGDPYPAQCEQTAQHLALAMGWRDDQWTLSFQSRFGPERWLEPYTDNVLVALHEQGVQYPLVFSPGFVTDCLETLDELGNEGREQFAEGGGQADHYHLAPCLNAQPDFLDFLAQLVVDNACSWANAGGAQANERDS